MDQPDRVEAVPAQAGTRSRPQRRLRLLARVAGLVETPLDLQLTLQRVADLAVQELADWCAVDLEPDAGPQQEALGLTPVRGRGPLLVAVAHQDPAMVRLALELQERYPPPEHDPERERMLTTLQPLHLPEVSEEMLAAGARDEQHLEILRSLGMSSAVAVPLQVAGRAFGVMLLVTTGGRRLDEDDVELAVELGRRAGAAVDKARLAARLSATAADLALSEQRYRTLVQAGSIGVFHAGPDGATTNEIEAWAGLTGGSTVGWSWLDAVHPADRETTRAAWLACVASGEPYQHTYRVRAAGDGWRWLTARAFPIRTHEPAGQVLEWIGSITDVTVETLAQARSQALLASAESLARAVDVPAVLASLRDVAARALGADAVVVAAARGPAGAVLPPPLPPDPKDTTAPDLRVLAAPEDLEHLPGLATALGEARAAFHNDPPPGGGATQTAWAALPLVYDGQVVAAVRLAWSEPQLFDTPHRLALQAMAAQYAAALTRARMYEAERTTSLTLQTALAPSVPRHVRGVEIGVHYRPAGVHAQVGGDWADALALPDGRVLLAVGDVMGSGIAAAATMGRLRTALAALALHESDPARLVEDLDRFQQDVPGDPLATLALAAVHSGRLDLWSAGHLPALVVPPGCTPQLVEPERTPPLGVGWASTGAPPPATSLALEPGTVVALCTDGLLETRDSQIDERLQVWCGAVAATPLDGDLDEVAAAVVRAIGPTPDDDVTLLLARV